MDRSIVPHLTRRIPPQKKVEPSPPKKTNKLESIRKKVEKNTRCEEPPKEQTLKLIVDTQKRRRNHQKKELRNRHPNKRRHPPKQVDKSSPRKRRHTHPKSGEDPLKKGEKYTVYPRTRPNYAKFTKTHKNATPKKSAETHKKKSKTPTTKQKETPTQKELRNLPAKMRNPHKEGDTGPRKRSFISL